MPTTVVFTLLIFFDSQRMPPIFLSFKIISFGHLSFNLKLIEVPTNIYKVTNFIIDEKDTFINKGLDLRNINKNN